MAQHEFCGIYRLRRAQRHGRARHLIQNTGISQLREQRFFPFERGLAPSRGIVCRREQCRAVGEDRRVRRRDDASASVAVRGDAILEEAHAGCIEPIRRLVQQPERGTVGEKTGESQALFLTGRQQPARRERDRTEAERIERLACLCLVDPRGAALASSAPQKDSISIAVRTGFTASWCPTKYNRAR
jgi:hypothetical protein